MQMRLISKQAMLMRQMVPATRFGFAVSTQDIEKALEQGALNNVLA